MKRILKSSLVLCIVLLMTSQGVFADSVVSPGVELQREGELLEIRNNLIIEAIKNGNTDFNSIIEENQELKELKNSNLDNISVEKRKLVKTEEVGNTIVSFYNDGFFITEELIVEESPKNTLASKINYKKAHNFAAAYNRFGNVIWTVFVEAEFGYDGEKVWVNGNPYGFYEKMGIINIWEVDDWHVDWTPEQGNLLARAYARGNFYWGLDVKGVGITFDNTVVDLRVSCNHNGTIFRSNGY